MIENTPAFCNICGCDYQKIAKGHYVCSNGHIFLIFDTSILRKSGGDEEVIDTTDPDFAKNFRGFVCTEQVVPQESLETRKTSVPATFQDAFRDGELEL